MRTRIFFTTAGPSIVVLHHGLDMFVVPSRVQVALLIGVLLVVVEDGRTVDSAIRVVAIGSL